MAQVLEIGAHQEQQNDYKTAAALLEAGDPDKAFALIDKKLLEDPNDAQALCIAAAILKSAKKYPMAYSLAKRAVELRQDRAEAWAVLGSAAQAMWRLDEAQSCFRKALQRTETKSRHGHYKNSLASIHLDGGHFLKAEQSAREALALSDEACIHHNLGLALLAQRKWEDGWKEYSASIGSNARLKMKFRSPEREEPVWDGTKDQTVIVYGEQGLGDEICAASMIPDVVRDSRKVIIDCDHRLEGLFKRSFPEASVHGTRWKKADWKGEAETCDASIAGFEVGKFYRNKTSDFPGTPYLVPCPDRTTMWRHMFARKQKPVIGIAWSGGIWTNASLYRQLPLKDWAPIFESIDAHWVSLQYKDASEDIKGTPVVQYSYATLTQDYDDTAAIVAACDLVIAVQTSVVHLAGSLGVPTWSLIPKTSQWRYGESYIDIPWYSSVRLIRQENDQWPITRICDELRRTFTKR